MSNPNLKTQLTTLLNQNPETFIGTLNEIFVEEWLKDQETELLMTNCFNPALITLLKKKIDKEIGEKYTKSPSKFSTLLDTFIEAEIIEKGTNEEKIKEIETNPQKLEGLKEVVKYFDGKEEW